MIQRIYIDNYRTLVNFEWKPERLSLLLGTNGTGKTSVLDVVFGLRGLITGNDGLRRSFSRGTLTCWESRLKQRYEIDAAVDGLTFRYGLTVEHHREDPMLSRIVEETLHEQDTLLVRFNRGDLHLYRDDGSAGPVITADWKRSAIGTIAEGKDNKKLTAFKRWLAGDVWCFRPDPRRMSARTDQDAEMLDVDLTNLASWYPSWVAEDLEGAVKLRDDLREVMPGFEGLRVNPRTLLLEAQFAGPAGSRPVGFDLATLSDGQRQLCALYLILRAVARRNRLVCVDEPDNYVALREIQPWLMQVVEAAQSAGGPQVWLISHHPEALDQLASDHGVRFSAAGGLTRIEPFRGVEGLTSSEVVARGWDDE